MQSLESKTTSETSFDSLRPLAWNEANQGVTLIDQRLLPYELKQVEVKSHTEMADAISEMVLRGAPLIGIAAAYGMALAAKAGADLCQARKLLLSTRPTAVNLAWALEQIDAVLQGCDLDSPETIYQKILTKAHWILEDDIERCKRMSEHGAKYIREKFGNKKFKIMTICNAGALATGGYGTALGLIRELAKNDLVEMVYACETRPRQQGSRLTAWELAYEQIPVTLISDNMVSHTMKEQAIDFVITGADRIAANGDTANKIGTYALAIQAQYHQVPFFVAAPESTFDRSLETGDLIPIEERSSKEVSHINDKLITAESGVEFYNPGFDVTPNILIERIFTELAT
ncbi:MAG: S-methyl-5-thioribose-1-phosphate isomerase [Candidatus Melainabacteria bacterium]|nr:S-methyl-5-thioribose-1-phosphate isomerase [Candidatus Melainabacteria bacterium]